MELDLNLIGNILIAIFIYNMVLKSIGATIIKYLLKSDTGKEYKKTFKDKLKDKLNEES